MKVLKLWLPVIFWAAFIFFLSSVPHLKTNSSHDYTFRKIAHFTEYFIITFLSFRAFKGSFRGEFFSLFFYSASLSLLLAIFDEIHQLFVPGRTGAVGDVLIDAVGILSCYVVLKSYNRSPIPPMSPSSTSPIKDKGITPI